MEKEYIEQTMKFKPWVKKVAVVVGILAALAICYNVLLGYNSATQLLVKQSPNGSMSCIDHAGFYFKGPFTTIYSYDRTKDFYFNSSTEKVKGEGWEGGEDGVKISWSKQSYTPKWAAIGCSAKVVRALSKKGILNVDEALCELTVDAVVRASGLTKEKLIAMFPEDIVEEPKKRTLSIK